MGEFRTSLAIFDTCNVRQILSTSYQTTKLLIKTILFYLRGKQTYQAWLFSISLQFSKEYKTQHVKINPGWNVMCSR